MAATLRLGRPLLLALATGAYLLLAHLTTASGELSALAALIAILPITLIALAIAWQARCRQRALGVWSASVIGLALAWPMIESRFAWIYFVQHLGVFSLLAVGFARSLVQGELPMVTRFAALVHGAALAPEVRRYTRGVTVVWALFFTMMAGTSTALFAFASLSSWSTFANFLTPMLVGLMFAIEFGVRRVVLPREVRTGLVDSIHAFVDAARRPSPPVF